MPSKDDYTSFLRVYYDELKEYTELVEKYEATHPFADMQTKYFTDPSTGEKIPFKFFKSGQKKGQRARETKLYKPFQYKKGIDYKLRTEFSNPVGFLNKSWYGSIESFLDAYERGEFQEKWVD